jgi:hypothetical protein
MTERLRAAALVAAGVIVALATMLMAALLWAIGPVERAIERLL